MSDLSWIPVLAGGAVGTLAGEWARQQSVARRLSPDSAARWETLGVFGRWDTSRRLRRGRSVDAPHDAAMAAEVAAVLRDQLAGRWLMGIAVAIGAVILLLAVVAMANDSVALGVLEAVVGALILSVPASQPRRRRRLAAAERANRDAA